MIHTLIDDDLEHYSITILLQACLFWVSILSFSEVPTKIVFWDLYLGNPKMVASRFWDISYPAIWGKTI